MALGLVVFQDFLDFRSKPRIYFKESLGDIFVYGGLAHSNFFGRRSDGGIGIDYVVS